MRKFSRKILSALLALALLVSLLPLGAAPAQAAQTVTLEGAGTAEDPYLIKNENDLAQFARIVSGNSGYVSNPNACAKLTANINLWNASWVPIGTRQAPDMDPIAFIGIFDGNGHTINNINIIDEDEPNHPSPDPGLDAYPSSADVGLFARLDSGGTVKNLKVTGNVSSGRKADNMGGIVGANNGGTVTNCTFVSGGVVGSNTDNSSVTNSYSTGDIGSDDKPFPVQGIFGGVVGSNSGNSSVTNCYNTGKFGKYIDGTLGGVVGSNVDTSSVTGCYNSGNVSGTKSKTVGGVVGNNGAIVDKCYFLRTDTVNTGQAGIGSGETTGATPVDDLTKQEQFSDWDFANTWRISQSLGSQCCRKMPRMACHQASALQIPHTESAPPTSLQLFVIVSTTAANNPPTPS